jgi:uncharacterized phage protein gp47/JayE
MAKIRRYDEIMEQACANMIARQDKITDFNEGSVIHTLLDTAARLAERNYIAIRQGYNENLRLIPYAFFEFKRKPGQKAAGTVVFSRSGVFDVQTVIPAGTLVSGNGKNYTTTAAGYIAAGDMRSNGIPIIAEAAGKDCNLIPYAINAIGSVLSSDVVSVENPNPITGGTDIETDEQFDGRFKLFINGLSGTTEYAIRAAALNVESVRYVSIKTHNPPLNNIYNMSIYVDDGSDSASESIMAAVKLAVEGDGTEQNQGHLAPGINIRVLPPMVVPVNLSIIIYTYQVDIEDARVEIQTALAAYINSLTIGSSVLLSEIISVLMKIA